MKDVFEEMISDWMDNDETIDVLAGRMEQHVIDVYGPPF